jgi:WD40 repeat protein
LSGSVAQAAESVLTGAQAMSSLEETQLRQAFLSLVRVNDEGHFTRRPANWADLPERIYPLLERFVQARLLVSRQENGARVLEVAHEALFRVWGRLAAWLDQDRAFLLWRKRLDQALDFWIERGKTRDGLLTGALLRESEAQLKENGEPLSNKERALIGASVAADRRWRLIRNTIVGGVAFVVIATSAISLFERYLADRQQTLALARRLTFMAEQVRSKPQTTAEGRGGVEESAELAAEAMQHLEAIGVHSVDADLAMRRGLALLPRRTAHFESPVPGRGLHVVAFNPDGQLSAAGSEPVTTTLWDITKGSILADKGGSNFAKEVVLSPDGKFLAATMLESPGELDVWEAGSLVHVARIHGVGEQIEGFALSPNGRYAAVTTASRTSNAEQTQILEINTNTEVARLPSAGVDLSFSPDGNHLAATVEDTKPKLWRMTPANTVDLQEIQIFPSEIRGRVVFSSDGTHIAVESYDETVRIWDLNAGKIVGGCKCTPVQSLSSGGRYIATFIDQKPNPQVFDAVSGNEVARPTASSQLHSSAFSAKGANLALMGITGAVDVWSVPASGSSIGQIQSGPNTIDTAFGADEEHLITFNRSEKGLTVNLWEIESGRKVSTLDLDHSAAPLALSGDGRYIATATPGGVQVLDNVTGRKRQSFEYPGTANAIALSPDGQFLSVAIGNDIHLVAIASPQEFARFKSPGAVSDLAISQRGNTVVAGSRGENLRAGVPLVETIWRAPAWKPETFRVGYDQSESEQSKSEVAAFCAQSADGKYIAGRVGLQNIESGVAVGLNDTLRRCAFSGDGRFLATIPGENGPVRLWDINTRDEVARIENVRSVDKLSLSPQARYLATTDRDGISQVWLLRTRDLVAEACSRLTRGLAPEEWKQLLGDEPHGTPACSTVPAARKH